LFLVKVACGLTHTLALSDKGNMFVWGGNVYGELGLDHKENTPSPMMVNDFLSLFLSLFYIVLWEGKQKIENKTENFEINRLQ